MRRVVICALALLLLCGCESRKEKEARERVRQLLQDFNHDKEQLEHKLDSIEIDLAAEAAARRKALINE